MATVIGIFEDLYEKNKPLTVVKPGNQLESISTKFGKEDIAILGEDIRYIRTQPAKWYKRGNQAIPIWVLNIYLLSFGLFVFPFAFLIKSVSHFTGFTEELTEKVPK